ncbi:MAG: radical SAM protein [Candidatus Woesearchaeota archaeon]|jgi:MoaA/NifB/PqqE/SkfB family radical SAM enzyme
MKKNKKLKTKIIPNDIIIYLTKRCNSRCPHCQWLLYDLSFFELSKTTDMPIDKAKEIIKFYKGIGTKNIRLQAEGEVLLYKYFEELVLFCEKIGYKNSGLPTNGILMDKYIDFLIKHFPSIMISVDGYDAETFISTRGGTVAIFEKVINNIKDLVNAKKKSKSKTIIGINCVINNKDYEKITPMVKLSEQLGVDRIKFSNYHAINGGNGLSSVSCGNLQKFQKITKNSKVSVSLPRIPCKNPPFRCSQLFETTLVGVDGSYAPCCRINSESKWGNYYTSDLKHNNFELKSMRKKFCYAKKISDLPENCQICSRLRGSR